MSRKLTTFQFSLQYQWLAGGPRGTRTGGTVVKISVWDVGRISAHVPRNGQVRKIPKKVQKSGLHLSLTVQFSGSEMATMCVSKQPVKIIMSENARSGLSKAARGRNADFRKPDRVFILVDRDILPLPE
jgi:hypothetical protein